MLFVLILACACSFGFLWQALVLTYEDAPAEEQMPYFGIRFNPLRPVWFMGRSARREPTCHPGNCLHYWSKERDSLLFW